MADHRRALLLTALGFFQIPPATRELIDLHRWLESWAGVGHIATGMHRQDYDLQLIEYDDRGWRATFFTTGMEHSITSPTAWACDAAPWRAMQRAAWALGKAA